MTFGRHWIAVAAVVPLLVLGACSQDDPQPKFSPPSDSPSATESTPTEPVVRPWEKKTEAGAVAFAKHWIDVFNAAQRNGQTANLKELSTGSCQSCAGFSAHLADIYSDGGRLESRGWIVKQAIPAKDEVAERAVVTLRIRQTPQEVVGADGSVERFRGGLATFSAHLEWEMGAWLMNELDLLT